MTKALKKPAKKFHKSKRPPTPEPAPAPPKRKSFSLGKFLPKFAPKLKPLPKFKFAKLKLRLLPQSAKGLSGLMVIVILLIIASLATLYFLIFKDLPSPSKLNTRNFPASTLIYDRNQTLLYEIYADQNRIPVELNQIPDYVKQATIAIEDKDFYTHQGVAVMGILRAVFRNGNYIACQIPVINWLTDKTLGCNVLFQGASTITQQLVKNALLTPDRTLQRKAKELILTFAVEVLYTKDQILEMYLNQIPYGGTAYGLEAASQTYFNKHASELTLAEATILAGLPQAPSRYSPFSSNPERYKDRQQAVTRRMLEDGYINQQQAEEIAQTKVTFAEPTQNIQAPHFVLWVKELLAEKYGTQVVETGGLRVVTSLDINLQRTAEATVSAEMAKLVDYKASNGAAMITNPGTGEVLAMVGSANYYNDEIDGKVNIALRYRQPGSSIKPLNYNFGFAQNLFAPGSIVADLPTCFTSTGSPPYCPQNYDGSFHNATTIRAALANSYNIPAVKVLALNDLRSFISQATAMGITGWDDPSRFGLSLTLGGGEVRMVDMAVAYSNLANLGVKVPLHPILKVTDATGRTIEEFKCQTGNLEELTKIDYQLQLSPDCQAERIFDPGAPYLTTHILSDRNARAGTFGSNLNIADREDVAVKTGTTNDLRDNWTVGYTPTRLTIVWVGNNDNTPMSRIASGITGAAPIWRMLMTQALQGEPKLKLAPPEGIIGVQICALTGMLPTEGCPTTFDLFPESLVPQSAATLNRQWPMDKTTGEPAKPDTPPENWEMQDKQIVFDILGDPICLNCAGNQSTNLKYPLSPREPQAPAAPPTQ